MIVIVNPDQFQVIIFNKERKTDQNEYTLSFGQYTVKSKNSVTLLGIEIDDRLTFTAHIHSLRRKAAGQLNYLISKKKLLNQQTKKIL